ncbi:DUF3833 domain-containing protein [Neptuniibacter sp. CAU 1671]|uniref:DUF3833 domain-containing protein n=1 Tax=Neptuniibacter sp. CAU 1671 TaxID=3032593 RepID=UPI0023DBC393|nr:DUF3833 domain-containing protein [Neptuniibacter sp. CAU 1671]MDF2182832.1 DUF3833 domain-containing protein [Neptuniibacter sp. CAU 1671]
MKACVAFLVVLLSGCASNIEEYNGTEPALVLSEFFSGHLEAHGIVQDGSGKVVRRFKADLLGHWQGDQGVLDEQFLFADGEEQARCWQLDRKGNQYTGRAGDVVGTAQGQVAGNALHWNYQLEVPVEGKVWVLTLDDWMYLLDQEYLINRTGMYKFGFKVGEITLFIRKISDQPHRELTDGCHLNGSSA